MNVSEIKYARGMYDAIITARKENGKLMAVIDKEIPDLDIYYSLDESNPDNYYAKYDKPICAYILKQQNKIINTTAIRFMSIYLYY